MTRSLAPLAVAALLVAQQAHAQEFTWETDLAKARATAKEESRPLLVVFR